MRLCHCLLLISAALSAPSILARAADPPWVVLEPVILETVPRPEGSRGPLHVAPAGMAWLNGVPYLAISKGIKSRGVLELWRGDDGWRRIGPSHEGFHFPQLSALGAHLGIVASMGPDPRGGYGNRIAFHRITPEGKLVEPRADVAVPDADSDRLTVSGVLVRGSTISVFLLHEKQSAPENLLLFARSIDGGATWSKPSVMGSTTMHEDRSRLGCLQWSDEELGRFVVERDGTVRFHRSRDGGRTWTHKDVVLTDDLAGRTRRLPLRAVRGDGWIGIVYLGSATRGKGRYYFSRSIDDGGTWEEGVPIGGPVKIDDPSIFIQLAAAGDRIAMGYLEILGSWTKGEFAGRLMLSSDAGRTWSRAGGDKLTGMSLFTALSADPSGRRFLYATATWMGDLEDASNVLRVHEVRAPE